VLQNVGSNVPSPTRPRRLFLSRATADRAVVEWVAAQMRATGSEIYLAEEDPQPGRLLADKVVQEVQASDGVLVLLTAKGHASPYVHQEVGLARASRKPIIALVEDGVDLGALGLLVGVEVIVFNPENLAGASASLFGALTRLGSSRPGAMDLQVQPAFQLQMAAQLELSANQLLVGFLVLSAVVGLVVVASHSAGGGAGLEP
jgi:hypothetical protein